MSNCENCRSHSVSGFRVILPAVPKCLHNGNSKTLPHVNKPTNEGGNQNVWNGTTPDWCPKKV